MRRRVGMPEHWKCCKISASLLGESEPGGRGRQEELPQFWFPRLYYKS